MNPAKAGAPKSVSPFIAVLEGAAGEYRLLSGEGSKCSAGSLKRLSGESVQFRLGSNILLSGIDEPESEEGEGGSCQFRRLTTSQSSRLTTIDRIACPNAPEEITTSRLEVQGELIRYSDGESNCVYEKVSKSTSPLRKKSDRDSVRKASEPE